jgi:hypothetical protein
MQASRAAIVPAATHRLEDWLAALAGCDADRAEGSAIPKSGESSRFAELRGRPVGGGSERRNPPVAPGPEPEAAVRSGTGVLASIAEAPGEEAAEAGCEAPPPPGMRTMPGAVPVMIARRRSCSETPSPLPRVGSAQPAPSAASTRPTASVPAPRTARRASQGSRGIEEVDGCVRMGGGGWCDWSALVGPNEPQPHAEAAGHSMSAGANDQSRALQPKKQQYSSRSTTFRKASIVATSAFGS